MSFLNYAQSSNHMSVSKSGRGVGSDGWMVVQSLEGIRCGTTNRIRVPPRHDDVDDDAIQWLLMQWVVVRRRITPRCRKRTGVVLDDDDLVNRESTPRHLQR